MHNETEADKPSQVTGRKVLPKGTVVKLGGVPFELTEDTPIKGDNRIVPRDDPVAERVVTSYP
jgi:hypothetical protein